MQNTMTFLRNNALFIMRSYIRSLIFARSLSGRCAFDDGLFAFDEAAVAAGEAACKHAKNNPPEYDPPFDEFSLEYQILLRIVYRNFRIRPW